ncbi:MAG: POTRA domain-containing protein [Candidatus Eisenbacteria bacterium]
MRLPCTLAFLAAVIVMVGTAAPADFNISGNSDLSDDAILEWIGKIACARSDSVCVDSICHEVAAHYWERGYLDVEVRCERAAPPDEAIEIAISEGRPSVLESVGISGVPAGEASVLEKMFAGQTGRPFSQLALEKGIGRVLAFYDLRGYPLSTVRPEMVSVGDGRVEVRLHVAAGPQADVGHVVFRGMTKTKRSAALAESGLSEGEPYQGKKIEGVRQRLMDLGIFENVSEPVLTFDSMDTTLTVTIDVVEARTSLFEGLAAYSPSGKESKFVGSLDLEFRSLGGTLRRLKVLWMKPGSGRLSWGVAYREPRILSKPFALECELSSDVIDTSYARRKVWLGVTFRGEPRLELGMGAFLGSTKDRSLVGGEGNFIERGLSFDLRYEGRDRPLNPLSGQFVKLRQEVAALEFEDDSSLDRTISLLLLEGEHLTAVGVRTALGIRGRFEGVFTSRGEIPQAHLVRMGGMRTLRGYPEEWFTVERAITVTLELRRLLGEYSRVYCFFDGAALDGGGYSFDSIRSGPFGYGLGFMAGSRTGIIRLEIALGRNDTWSDAKLHLGLVRRF